MLTFIAGMATPFFLWMLYKGALERTVVEPFLEWLNESEWARKFADWLTKYQR